MSDFKNKKIILAVPNHFGLPEVFQKNLQFLGFTVFLIQHDPRKLNLTFSQSALHFFRKSFKKDKTYKQQIISKEKEKPQLEFLENIDDVDFALVIRPDLFSDAVLKKIKLKSTYSAAYQWDGMNRFPLAKSKIKFFDRFFVFDKNDTGNFPGTEHSNNFYFDYLPTENETKQDVFFVGTFMKDRISDLAQLANKFKELGLKTIIYIVSSKEKYRKKYGNSELKFQDKGLSFEESMKKTKESKIILDFQNVMHKGLSIRAFEAVGYQKKMITNNSLIKNYEFYNQNNIFLFDDNLNELEDFLKKPYISLSNEIIEKYSFTNFINKIFSASKNGVQK